MNKNHAEDLTKEKNLWQIFNQCYKLRKSNFNQIITTITLLLLTTYYCSLPNTPNTLSDNIEYWAGICLDYSGSILGFIIAGYTILLTLAPSDFFIQAAQVKEKHSGLKYIKVFQFTFIEVFILYLSLVIASILCKAFFLLNGPYYSLLSSFKIPYPTVYSISIKVMLTTLITSLMFVTLKLKSFIYNIYIVSMAILRFTAEDSKE